MQAVISLLPEPYNTQVDQIWKSLEDQFGLRYIRITPFPHFTLQLGEGYQEEEVLPRLNEFCLRQEPFEVCTKGLNYFSGEKPVLFIEVCKSPQLLDFYLTVWNLLLPYTLDPSPLYSPESWQPHITLALEDLSWEMLDEVTASLNKVNLEWHFMLDGLAIACQHADGKAQLEHIFQFGKGLTESFDCGQPVLKS